MFKSYIKAGWRNILKSKVYSVINIGGLAAGMAVAMLIGLWVYDELSFNHYHSQYPRVAQVYQFVTFDGKKAPYTVMPSPMADELREHYPDFEKVAMAYFSMPTVAYEDNKFAKQGIYAEPDFTSMMSVKVVEGNDSKDMNSILLSASYAQMLFGNESAINKILTIDNKLTVTVAGVYEDIPRNSDFWNVNFIAPWSLFVTNDFAAKSNVGNWENNNYQVYAQLKEGADFAVVSGLIKDIRMKKDSKIPYKPEFFLHPMSQWHLHSTWQDGKLVGGRIESVKVFSLIGVFIVVLACINFMNLSTARSEKRAKEIGIRKTLGSFRTQLITQLFSETFLVVGLAFGLSLVLVQLALPTFNTIADKDITILWSNPLLWLSALSFCLITGFFAGSYPALYLSSFRPAKILRGTSRAGKFAVIPRKVLVVTQFSVSIILIVSTMIVYNQIQHSKTRPSGYNRERLITIQSNTTTLHDHFDALRHDLLQTGAIEEVAESSTAVTGYGGLTTSLTWQGKDPEYHPLFGTIGIGPEFGKVMGYQIIAGRDMMRQVADIKSIIINQTAAQLMGFKDPVGQGITLYGDNLTVIGVVKDMLMESPFEMVKPTIYYASPFPMGFITVKLAANQSMSESLKKVEPVFQKYDPSVPFDFEFVDEAYAKKFASEERMASLAGIFASLAIFISCLGLFGLASFVAEQRTKEIAVRKIMGASVPQLWQLLSKDFVVLVIISCGLAVPVSFHYMNKWLAQYDYRVAISWVTFAQAGLAALLITLATISYQTLKAAVTNPVNSLKSE